MNVVWELNIASLTVIVTQTIWLTVFLFRASDRSVRAEKKADEALQKLTALETWMRERTSDIEKRLVEAQAIKHEVREAYECASRCKEAVALLSSSFSAYREMAASNFINKDDMRDLRAGLGERLDKLGDRIERIVEHRGPVHRE